jgi:hypothetical protein
LSKYGFDKFGYSDAEVEAAVANDAKVNAGLNEKMEREVVPFWRSKTPMLKGQRGADKRVPGAARASVKVTRRARGGRGGVGMTVWYAHLLEFGTRGSTPTPEFAPGRKTAAHFGGTINAKGASHSGSDTPGGATGAKGALGAEAGRGRKRGRGRGSR